MPNLSFRTILTTERQMLAGAAKQLAIFDKEVEQAQDQVGEQVYASLVTAYQAAQSALQEMEQIIAAADQATQAGQIATHLLPPHMADVGQQMIAQTPDKVAAINRIILSLRFCSLRPSDIWRGEIRIQAGALLERMFAALAGGGASAQVIEQMAEVYTSAFCWFETAWFDDKPATVNGNGNGSLWSHLFSLKGAGVIGLAAIAGYFGGNYAVEMYNNYMGGGQADADVGEDEDEEGGEEEVEETIIDIPSPDEVQGVI